MAGGGGGGECKHFENIPWLGHFTCVLAAHIIDEETGSSNLNR